MGKGGSRRTNIQIAVRLIFLQNLIMEGTCMLTRHFSILLTLALLPASAFAIDNVARVSLSPNASGGGGPIDDIHQGLGPQDASDSTTGGFNTTLTGTAHTDYGHVHLTATGSGTGNAG